MRNWACTGHLNSLFSLAAPIISNAQLHSCDECTFFYYFFYWHNKRSLTSRHQHICHMQARTYTHTHTHTHTCTNLLLLSTRLPFQFHLFLLFIEQQQVIITGREKREQYVCSTHSLCVTLPHGLAMQWPILWEPGATTVQPIADSCSYAILFSFRVYCDRLTKIPIYQERQKSIALSMQVCPCFISCTGLNAVPFTPSDCSQYLHWCALEKFKTVLRNSWSFALFFISCALGYGTVILRWPCTVDRTLKSKN